MKLKFTPSAKRELLDAIAHIAREDPRAARRYRKKVEDSLRRLETFPNSGRIITEFLDLDYREVIVPPYRFFYSVKAKTVWVVALWHGAQLPESPS